MACMNRVRQCIRELHRVDTHSLQFVTKVLETEEFPQLLLWLAACQVVGGRSYWGSNSGVSAAFLRESRQEEKLVGERVGRRCRARRVRLAIDGDNGQPDPFTRQNQ